MKVAIRTDEKANKAAQTTIPRSSIDQQRNIFSRVCKIFLYE